MGRSQISLVFIYVIINISIIVRQNYGGFMSLHKAYKALSRPYKSYDAFTIIITLMIPKALQGLSGIYKPDKPDKGL